MKQTILIPRNEINIVSEIMSRGVTKEVIDKYGEKGIIFENSIFFDGNVEVILQLVIDDNPYTELVLYKNDEKVNSIISTEGKYAGLWTIEYDGMLYEIEVNPGMADEDWQKLFKEKYEAEEFQTDSDIEDFADECGVGYGSVFHYLDILTSIGTECEGCKNIGFRFRMFPCNSCSKNPSIINRYEK